MSSMGNQRLFELQSLANTYYDNDLDAMYKDAGRKLPLEEKRKYKGTSLDFEYINESMTKANRLLSGVNKYKNALRRLGATADIPEVEQIEEEALAAVTSQDIEARAMANLGDRSNPYEPKTEEELSRVPVGSFYRDPAGNLYQREDQ